MMELNQATPLGDAAATTLNATWTLATANSSEGLRYRQSFMLTLPTGGLAEELLIDATTSLQLKARHLIFNALDVNPPEAAQVEQFDSTGLLVTLPVPRLIHSIRFANSLSPSGKTTQLFRTDGDTVSEDPVASHVNSIAKHGKNSKGKSKNSSKKDSQASEKFPHDAIITHNNSLPGGLPSGELDVIDGRILVRLKASAFEPLQSGSITQFNLTTGPENLRIGVRIPALGSELFFIPLTFELDQQVDAGSALHTQLSALIQRLQDKLADEAPTPGPPPTLPDPLTLELAVESDAPCRFTMTQFAIRYRLVRHSFPGGEPKQVLRFANGQPEQQHLSFEIPSSVNLADATLRVAGDGSGPTPGDTLAASSGQLSSLLELTEESGVRLDADHRWSSPIVLTEAMLCGGWNLLLSALSPNTQLHLEIVADNSGVPGGERLAFAEATLQSPHRPQLLRFTLASPLLLQPGGYWLMVESRDGAAVWRLHAQPGARTLPWGGNGGEGMVIADLAGVANWIASDGPVAATQRFPEITLADQPLPLTRDGNDWVYDLTPALGATTASGTALLSRELDILATGPKPVTIYAPRIEYEL